MDVSTDRFAMRDIDVKLYNICSKGTVEEVLRLINRGRIRRHRIGICPWTRI